MSASSEAGASGGDSPAVLSRKRQWVYLGPVMAAPLAHIAVSCYRFAKTRNAKIAIIGGGVVGATALSIGMRMYLMMHAGYPGGAGLNDDELNKRIETIKLERHHVTTEDGRDEIVVDDTPMVVRRVHLMDVLRDALKGFG